MVLHWKDMYEKEHKLRLEAEGETHLVKAVGMNSPEMKEVKKKLRRSRKNWPSQKRTINMII